MLGQRLGLMLVAGLAVGSVACAGRQGGAGGPEGAKQPMGHVEVKHLESPDDAPETAKTVEVSYIFDRDIVNKDFDKTFKDGFDKKGVRVDEELNAHAHFGVNNAKITGTVTYVKKSMGRFSIIEANLVAEAHYEADVQLDLDVKVKGDTKNASDKDWDGTAMGGKPFTIVKNVMPTNIPIAGPLFLHAHFDLTAACDLGVEGQMHATTGVGIKGDAHLEAKYKKAGFEPKESGGKKSRFAFEAKAPNFELAPKPYVKVEGKQQSLKGKCSLQPTAVLLLEHSVGAKLIVEPWVELEASRPSSKSPWKLDAQAGVSVNAATDIELFGRQLKKAKEFNLYEIALTKKGDAMGAPRVPGVGPTPPQTKGGRPAQEIAKNSNATPAEDLRNAEAPANPFAAEAPEAPAPVASTSAPPASAPAAAPAPSAAAAPSAPSPSASSPAKTASAETPAPASASATTTTTATAANQARSALTRATASIPDPRIAVGGAAPPAPADAPTPPPSPAPATPPPAANANANTAAPAAKTEVASAATPAIEPAPPAEEPPSKSGRGKKKKKKDTGSATASIAPTTTTSTTASGSPSSSEDPASEPVGKDKKKKKPSSSLLDAALGKPVAARKSSVAAGVSKLVRKKP